MASTGFLAFAQQADSVEERRQQREAILRAREQHLNREVDAAVETLTAAVNLAPNSREVPCLLLYKGSFVCEQGNPEAALGLADQCVQVFPSRAEGFYLRAIAHHERAELHEAVQAYKVANDLEPTLQTTNPIVRNGMMALAGALQALRHKRIQEAFRQHADAFRVYEGGNCAHCHATYTTATPNWLCTRCWISEKREVPIWEPDSDAKTCRSCDREIGRGSRHHCRCCGRVYCGTCSSKKAELPLLRYERPQRVCNRCDITLRVHRGQLPPTGEDGDLYATAEAPEDS